MSRTPLGLAWGVACLGAGLRWGTLGMADVAVATRLNGPTVTSGPLLVRVGMIAALAGALAGEGALDSFATRTWGERAAAAAALVALIPLFVVRGPGDPHGLLPLAWGLAAVAGTTAVLRLRPVVALVPAWGPVALAGAGVALAGLVR
jgi:hypothetical protein